ncbi:MAG: hypothetical protein JZU60_02460 [Ilumatobacteraceae bacterium]|nr:hypothetical protein [Ilumatobacteraceae bacterium]
MAAGGAATDVALTATKLVSKVIFGAIIAGTLSFAWVAAHQWKGDISQLTFDYGFWLGSGGYWFILACAIGYPFVSKNSVETSTSAAAPAVAPQGPSIFERKAKLRRQGKYWLITCAVAAVGGLAHSVLPMSVAELFGGPLTMLAVALPFWALGLLMDLLKISAARMRN